MDRDLVCVLGTATCIHPSTTSFNGSPATPLVTEDSIFKNPEKKFWIIRELRTFELNLVVLESNRFSRTVCFRWVTLAERDRTEVASGRSDPLKILRCRGRTLNPDDSNF